MRADADIDWSRSRTLEETSEGGRVYESRSGCLSIEDAVEDGDRSKITGSFESLIPQRVFQEE